jgi:kinesin family protein 5
MEEENKEAAGGNVRVLCRFRPLNQEELKMREVINTTISDDNKNLTLHSSYEAGEPLKFNFDYIFPSSTKQPLVYSVAARPIVEAVMQGFNGTVFAYGQTSSGKTFTMTGPDLEDPDLMGVIPRMVSTVFDIISNSEPYIEYSVKVSYCEIYLEKIKDLLDTSKVNLKIHEDKTRGVYIDDLTEKYVSCDRDVYEVMKSGLDNRNVGSTNMNAVSSRSHSIFLITVSQTNNKDYIAKTGKLYLVDLAGSEKVGKTGAAGKRLEEAKNINKSLTMLGLVIYSLTDGKSTHIPYRDSKLTRVLQDSLGGNSKTALIITCSPSLYNEAETISTLRFGMRAKAIKNTPKINREYTVAELKVIWNKCKEEIAKKDKRIKYLEESLGKIGCKVEAELGKESDDEETVQEESKREAHDEIIDEVERFRTQMSEEVKKGIEVKMKILEQTDELNSCRSRLEFLVQEGKGFRERSEMFEPNLKNKDAAIKVLESHKENLDSEMLSFNQRIIELEKKNREIENELQEMKNREPAGRSSLNNFKDLLRTERDTNAGYQKEIFSLRQNLNEILAKKCPEMKVNEMVRDDISKREREKWIDERKKLILDLQKSLDRVADLEILVEQAKDSCKNLEGYLSGGERNMKKNTDTLERSLEQLTIMYHQLTSQKSQLGIDKRVSEKRLAKLNERNKFLEVENKQLAVQLEQAEQKLLLTMGDSQSSMRNSRISIGNSNIKKTIMGGAPGSKRASVNNNKIPFIQEDR